MIHLFSDMKTTPKDGRWITNRSIAKALVAATLCVGGGGTLGAVTVDNFVARWYTNAQGVLPYRLFIPTNYTAGTRYPIVLFMCGSGERGTDNRLQLTGQTGCLVFASETNQLYHPSFMVAPQCSTSSAWTDASIRSQVLGLMNLVMSQYSIDTNRLYITGLSLGGMGSWDYIGQFPNMYAAAIPMSGSGTVSLAPKMTQTAIWNFHAANDSTVNVSGSRTMIDAVRRAGGNAVYTEYASGGHGIWTPAYNTPILMEWVYSQRRGASSTARPLLSISAPTDQPIYGSSATSLGLSGTASDGSTGPGSVTWSNYVVVGVYRGVATGTTNWTVPTVAMTTSSTNLILVTGAGTSWNASLGGTTTFNDTLSVIFPPFISLDQPESRAVNEGDTVTFTSAVNPVAPLPRYQWRFNGTNLAGATVASLVLTNVHVSDAGAYSVRITNQFGGGISRDALLTVNRFPVARCVPVIVPAGANCLAQASVDNGSYDPDGDPITLSQAPPGPYPLGNNTVLLTVTDNKGASNTCLSSVLVVDRTPPELVCPADIVLTNAHDAWTSVVTFSPAVSDNCAGVGQAVCHPSSGSAFGLGTHLVTCAVVDAAGNSSQCTFRVTVRPGNVPPVPIIQVSPLARFPGYTNLIVIAPDNANASVVFDGSGSYDPDDAHFNYFWYEGTNLFSTNVVATHLLEVGTHEVVLKVDDTYPLGTNSASVTVEVITPAQAVGIVIGLLEDANLPRNREQPLMASLQGAVASFERGNMTAGANQLGAFQNKVSAQVTRLAPDLAEELISAAQTIIDALSGKPKPRPLSSARQSDEP
jgi:poly(3-hydroxybutyrate) depolymerase